ncbi:hypothetical protein [Chryseosolibacter indicus]|uniref:DUF2892 domain-containing protein n=1 Tax=Chryseosolibacter indicus TaxID=2782351 RepID=A0ABS5VYS0_9BACT|nr:hypothetical protein [Chryseosolibacter indicus]MBT1706461.1 hypothetical protein [Chryseosolibacter indicus]
MYTPIVRVIILVLGLILGFYYYMTDNPTPALLTLFGVALVVWGYFKNGTVYLAWRKVKKQDFQQAERILSQTKYPELLKREQKGFYHFIKAMISANANDIDNAYINFKKALQFGVRTQNN